LHAVWAEERKAGVAKRDLIVIGTSTGGVEALSKVVSELPSGFPATIFVVCHIPAGYRSILPEILSRSGPLLAIHPTDGEPFYPGHVYVAPPDRHLLLGPDGRMRLSREARENNHRPAVDPLFRSAARHYGPRVIGVVLTGALHDGAAGLLAIRRSGGLGVIQDPSDATLASMPLNAAQVAGADYVVPISRLTPLLVNIVQESQAPDRGDVAMDPIERMPDVVERDMDRQVQDRRRGDVSVYTCPGCGGSLWQVDEAGVLQFRCHVGHAYNGEILLAEQTDALEAALWTAVRTFREKSVLSRQLAVRERSKGDEAAASRFDEQAGQADRYGNLILRYVLDGAPPAGGVELPPVGEGPGIAGEGASR
jgi:two-component system, chemotaxis family, protein-glutamate methylesterase/glutaminase